jgi:hypothetical protein
MDKSGWKLTRAGAVLLVLFVVCLLLAVFGDHWARVIGLLVDAVLIFGVGATALNMTSSGRRGGMLPSRERAAELAELNRYVDPPQSAAARAAEEARREALLSRAAVSYSKRLNEPPKP